MRRSSKSRATCPPPDGDNKPFFSACPLAVAARAPRLTYARHVLGLRPPSDGHKAAAWLLSLQIAACLATNCLDPAAASERPRRPALASSAHATCPPAASPFAADIAEAAQRFAIPEAWIRAVMAAESGGDARAVSPKGAIGLMQVMPQTYAVLRVRHRLGADPCKPHDNILAGAGYLREMFDRYGASGFLAAYNAGPTRYDDHLATGRPLPDETRAYVAKIASTIGIPSSDDPNRTPFDLFALARAALFPERPNAPQMADLPDAKTQPDRSPATHRIVDLSALAPQSDSLFVRPVSDAGAR